MIENVSTFKYQESELDIKIRQASQLRLDASSAEAVKQLKGTVSVTVVVVVVLMFVFEKIWNH